MFVFKDRLQKVMRRLTAACSLERRVLKFLIRTLCGDGNELLKISSNQTFGGFVFETDFGFLSVTESEPEPDGWQDTEFRMLKYKGVRYACLYGQETGALTVKDAASCHTAFSVFFYLPNAQELAELKDKARQDKSWIAYAVFLNNTSMYPSLDPYLDITKAVVDVIQKGYRFGFYNGELLAMQEGTAITVQKLAEQQKAYIKTWRLPEEREY